VADDVAGDLLELDKGGVEVDIEKSGEGLAENGVFALNL
jgi:hypothetical protein